MSVDNSGDRSPDYWLWDMGPGQSEFHVYGLIWSDHGFHALETEEGSHHDHHDNKTKAEHAHYHSGPTETTDLGNHDNHNDNSPHQDHHVGDGHGGEEGGEGHREFDGLTHVHPVRVHRGNGTGEDQVRGQGTIKFLCYLIQTQRDMWQ